MSSQRRSNVAFTKSSLRNTHEAEYSFDHVSDEVTECGSFNYYFAFSRGILNTCGELGKESVRERGSGRERKRGGPPVLQASGGRLARGNRTRTAPCGELAGYRQPWVGFLYLRCSLNQLLIDVWPAPRALLERSVDRQSLYFLSVLPERLCNLLEDDERLPINQY